MTCLLAHAGSPHLHLGHAIAAMAILFALGLWALVATNNQTKGK